MPNRPLWPTPYADVKAALEMLLAGVGDALGRGLVGAYLSGSLALGDFDPRTSDVDLVVVTAGLPDDERFAALAALHEGFRASGSPWAAMVEAVYVPAEALREAASGCGRYPVLERERPLAWEPLEDAWAIQLHTLRRHGVALCGPAAADLVGPVARADLDRASLGVAHMWQRDAREDPTWLDWVAGSREHAFVVLTLCRLLYTLECGDVASKSAAARWAKEALDARWRPLIDSALAQTSAPADRVSPAAVAEAVAFVQYTVERGERLTTPPQPLPRGGRGT